jgi:hypothetical protein
VATRLRDIVREVYRTNEIEIPQRAVSRDHVLSAGSACEQEYTVPQWKKLAEADAGVQVFAAAVQEKVSLDSRGLRGIVTDEVIMEYIRLQDSIELDDGDNFHVSVGKFLVLRALCILL